MSLGSKFIRQMSFEFEKQFFLKSIQAPTTSPTFVTGLARSGTTILLRALYETQEFASLTYEDMPFLLAPNVWGRLNSQKPQSQFSERAHGDGILVNTESPEAFEEVFWLTYDLDEAAEEFSSYIQLILHRHQKCRYLSKNNQNVKRIKTLSQLFPEAIFLVPFRDPLQHAQSLLTQHNHFCKAQDEDNFVKDYMDWIGHSEFGLSYKPIVEKQLKYTDPGTLNHWLEQWYLLYSMLKTNFNTNNNIHFICYERLCADNELWECILAKLALNKNQAFDFRESRKPISFSYDESLYAKARDLYSSLREI